MKSVKAICSAAVLALALSVPAYAGEISSPGSPCSNPPPDATNSEPGDIHIPGAPSPGDVGFPPAFADVLSALIWLF
jgi:hypothetical protein